MMCPDTPGYADDALEDDDLTFPPSHCGPGPDGHRVRAGTWVCVCGDLIIEEEED